MWVRARFLNRTSGTRLLQKYCSQKAHAYCRVARANIDAFSKCSPLYQAVNASQT